MWPATFDAGDPHVRFDERDLETEHSCATAPDLDSTHAKCIRALLRASLQFRTRLGADGSLGDYSPLFTEVREEELEQKVTKITEKN
jgi:hypothetical protein